MKLHLRAADWYEANGSPALALEHLLCTDGTGSLRAVGDGADPADLQRRSDVDRRAMAGDARRRECIEAYPPLAVLAGWIAVLTGQSADAERWAALVDVGDVRSRAAGRLGFVRLGPGDVAGGHVRIAVPSR